MSKFDRRRNSRALLSACCVTFAAIVSGCSHAPMLVTADELCKDWRNMTVSKKDVLTQETAEQIEASNLSRVNWGCKLGENRAG